MPTSRFIGRKEALLRGVIVLAIVLMLEDSNADHRSTGAIHVDYYDIGAS